MAKESEINMSSMIFFGLDITGLHKWGGAHQTFLNTQFTWESLVRVVGRGEVGITGHQPYIDAW